MSADTDPNVLLYFFFLFFFNLTYSRWTSSLPSCLWSIRIFPSLPGSRLTTFCRDASSALLQLVNQWLNFTMQQLRDELNILDEVDSAKLLVIIILDALPFEKYSTIKFQAIGDPDFSLEEINDIKNISINHSKRSSVT